MLELLVGISVISLYVGIILFIFARTIIKIIMVVSEKFNYKSAMKVVLIPFSIGVYAFYNKKDRLFKTYQILEVVTLFFLLLGSVFLFYTRFA